MGKERKGATLARNPSLSHVTKILGATTTKYSLCFKDLTRLLFLGPGVAHILIPNFVTLKAENPFLYFIFCLFW